MSIDDLLMGMVSNTSRNKGFTCPICGKNFEDQLTPDVHKKMDHTPEGEAPAVVT